MSRVLNITNGDCAVELMRKAGIPGKILPWRDVLHIGPVPARLPLDELSAIRARFLAKYFDQQEKDILCSFQERDRTLASIQNDTRVILWFEHDLYDQLQLLQILDWFGQTTRGGNRLSLVCTEQYLGRLKPADIISLLRKEEPVSDSQLELANRAWGAFRDTTPQRWHALLKEDTQALPFLEDTITRVLEEFPALENGLSRTEQQALSIIAAGETHPHRLFSRNQEMEERIFMGDSGFWKILRSFANSSPPLLKETPDSASIPETRLNITSTGRSVLQGQKNWLDIHPPAQWIGGVHLNQESVWCWDAPNGSITRVT